MAVGKKLKIWTSAFSSVSQGLTNFRENLSTILVVETGGHRQTDTQIFEHKHRTLWLRDTNIVPVVM